MAHKDKQPRRASKADVSTNEMQAPSDVDTRKARGGDKERNAPQARRMTGTGQPETTPSRKPRR
jgi:hypothetical protein